MKITAEELLKARIKKCNDEVDAVLKKYNCAIDCSVTIGQGQIQPKVFIVALKEQPKPPIVA